MKVLARTGLAGIVGALGLVFAGPALASYTPKLTIGHSARASAAGAVTIDLTLAPTDDPTAKLTIYSPAGYTANPTGAPGTQIGTVEAQVVAADLGGGTLPLTGVIQIADPNATITLGGAQLTVSAAAQACTQTPTHGAFWLMNLLAGGQQLQIPAFVDATTGAETAAGGFKIQICLSPPDVPAGTPGRAAFGAKLFHAKLTLTNVFTTPAAPNIYIWRALFTPYTPGAGTPNTTGTLEARSVALMPIVLTLSAKYDAKTKSAKLSGKLTVAGEGAEGVAVPLFAGPTASLRSLKRSGSTSQTDSSGNFTATRRIAKTTYFIVVVGTGGDVTQPACAEALPSLGVPCANGTFAEVFTTSSLVKVVVPKAKPKPKPKKKKKT